ncbi:hypothetical protein Sa4125_39070 [Aureimonas sp. SA4125]|uniref:hypothetical protein n=1 Tax=Aureimonas sp. SA4125 TaxID=2826993 RepID=UPI001CC35D4B|nr:hypothetical protein [Aureimonas sp. SA4125]BDA86365.1 hypothetical protein Sa4125_39070 [Aureimonas sp. SA4125]
MVIVNNPAIGQAAANIASLFAPPSGAEAAGWAAANAKRAEAKRLADFYAGAPEMDAAAYDRVGPALGLWTPNQGVGITQRGQDIGSADARYGVDVGAITSRTNNAADNTRALTERQMQESGLLARQFAEPIKAAPGETVFLPGQTASATGLAPTLAGAPKPLSTDETVAAVMQGLDPTTLQQFAADKFAPTESQVQGQERRRLAADGTLDDQALLDAILGERAPVEAIGSDGRLRFMAPGAAIRTGAEPAPRSPLVNVNNVEPSDGKLRNKLDEAEGTRWSALQAAATTASGLQQDLDLLSALIDEAPQGPLTGRLSEYFPELTTAGSAFQSVVSRAAPGLRVEGSGATSDIEYQGMVRSLPRLRNKPEGNRLIVDMMRAKADINVERGTIVNAYQVGDIDAPEARRRLDEINRVSIMTPELRSMMGGAENAQDTGAGGTPRAPTIEPGTVEDGFRFRGGDPADAANWEAVG